MTSGVRKGEFDGDTVVGPRDPDTTGSLQVVIVADGAVPRSVPLPRVGDLRIGRHNASEIPIDDASISRFHAVLRVKGTTITIEDRGSANGTKVGTTQVKPGKEAPVAVGETIRLGTVTLLVQPVGARR
jgi:pSer/pThr/pTyr-binding forkhead associated (FHA) protein